MALTGDTAVVGCFGDDIGPNANRGSVYVFERQEGAWTKRSKLTTSDGAFDVLGYSVGINADTIVAGASGDDEASNLDQGSAYLFPAHPNGRRRAVRK